MKALLISSLLLFSSFAFAAAIPAPDGELTINDLSTEKAPVKSTSNLTEFGLEYTSINNGSTFASIDVMHEWDRGFALGVRGYLPLEYNKQEQAFMGQLVGRVILINEEDQMFVDANVTQGFFNTAANTSSFAMVGADLAYAHKINRQFRIGGNIGADYSTTRITEGKMLSNNVVYNKIGLSGTYYF